MTGEPEEPPPVLGSWRAVYVLVLATLAAFTGLMAWLAHAYP